MFDPVRPVGLIGWISVLFMMNLLPIGDFQAQLHNAHLHIQKCANGCCVVIYDNSLSDKLH